jgi:hypothetical protein
MTTFLRKALYKTADRPFLTAPFRVGEYLCASDGYRLHAIKDTVTDAPNPTPKMADGVLDMLKARTQSIAVERDDLLTACKQARALQPEGGSVLVYVDAASEKLCVQAQSKLGTTECVITAQRAAMPAAWSVCLNVAFIIAALESFKRGTCLIELPSFAGNAVRFVQDDQIAVIMPMKGETDTRWDAIIERQHPLHDAPVHIPLTPKQQTAQRRNMKHPGSPLYKRKVKKSLVPPVLLKDAKGKAKADALKHAEWMTGHVTSELLTGVEREVVKARYDYRTHRTNHIVEDVYKVDMLRLTNGRDVVDIVLKSSKKAEL